MLMRKLTVRFDEELYRDLKAVSLAEGGSMAEIIRDSVLEYTRNTPEIEKVKSLIARARSSGSVSEREALEAARIVAEVDDEEGLGDLQRRKDTAERDAGG
jgi:transposase